MTSKGEKELLAEEINYLTNLIQSHKGSNKPLTKTVYPNVGHQNISGRHAYRSNLSATTCNASSFQNVASNSKTTHARTKLPTTTANPTHGKYSLVGEQRTRQGNLVYRPKESKCLSSSTTMTSEAVHGNIRTSQLMKPERTSATQIGPTLQRSSRFVYYGNQQGQHLQGSSTFMLSTVAERPISDAATNRPVATKDDKPTSKLKTRTSATLLAERGSIFSPASSSSPPHHSSTSKVGTARKRRRTSSKSKDSGTTTKKCKRVSTPLNAQKSGEYVWTAKSISNQQKASAKLLSPLNKLPRRSQLKWRRKSLDSVHKKAIEEPSTSKTSRSPHTKRTPSSFSLPVQTEVATGSSAKLHQAATTTPLNTRYKWRRRLTSSGSKKGQSLRSPTSSWVIQSKYKLARASLLQKYSKSTSRKRLSSFTQRHVAYMLKNSPHHTQRPLAIKQKKSKNRVWVADSTDVSNQSSSKRLGGHESKTKQGNRQWIASSIQRPSTTRKRLSTSSKGNRTRLVSLRGQKFVMDSSKRRLKRVPSAGLLRWSGSTSDVGKSISVTRILASRVIRRSKANVWHAKQKGKQQRAKQYCMFFNRFGKCNRKDTCPYIHDPDKVAICTKFLRGICDKTDGTCPFSHKIMKEKMPACSFFLRGVCTRENCPYLHVSVGQDAEVCPDFLKGYCPQGEECTKQHTLDCPEFSRSGSCPRGGTCPMRHRKRAHAARHTPKSVQGVVSVKEPSAFRKVRQKQVSNKPACSTTGAHHNDTMVITPGQLEFIPLEKEADFIAL